MNSPSKAIRAIRKEISKLQERIQESVLPEFQVMVFTLINTILTYLDRVESNRNINTQLINAVSDAVFILDDQFCILKWNHAATLLYGWADVQLQHKPIQELVSETVFLSVKESLERFPTWEGEQVHTTRHGESISVHTQWNRLSGFYVAQASYFLICKDLSVIKRLQSQLIQSQRLESVGLLTSGIAHDLNNVLTPVFLGVKILQSEIKDVKLSQVISLIESSAKRGEDLVRQILNYISGQSMAVEKVNVYDLIQDLNQLFVSSLPSQVQFVYSIGEGSWFLKGERTPYFQILLNLCLNAKDSVIKQGKIEVAVENVVLDVVLETFFNPLSPGDYIKLSVRDNGKGIPKSDLQKIFEPFFSTKSHLNQGTGLGLSTVHTLVQGLQGGIQVESVLNEGTVFTLFFPAIRPS